MDKLIEVRKLKKYFPISSGLVFKQKTGSIKAVDGISFCITRGETLGLVGESGCGKTTAGRTILGLYSPTEGEVIIEGKDICKVKANEMLGIRRKATMIFQDPFASLNPRWTVNSIVSEPLRVHKLFHTEKERNERVFELFDLVGTQWSVFIIGSRMNFPVGKRQRIGIARHWHQTRILLFAMNRFLL